jgi:hypothetical protein
MEGINLDGVNKVVSEFVASLKHILKENKIDASGALSKSIKGNVKLNGKWIEISVSMEDYWKYIENGTSPHFPPVDKIKQWIKVKPVLPRAINGKIPTTEQLAFLIARKISKFGTKPKPFFEPTIEQFNLVNKLYEIVSEEIDKQIQNDIDN